MVRNRFNDEYFIWLCNLIQDESMYVSYDKLLEHLHDIEFRYLLPMDQNCAEYGVYMRYRFAGRDADYIVGPCTVLEMMVALALRCEENIMDDPLVGNRTGQWFWEMIVNLGLGAMYDRQYDGEYVESVINRFLDRQYEPDGRGGLFTIKYCDYDLRKVLIRDQLYWYLDTIT